MFRRRRTERQTNPVLDVVMVGIKRELDLGAYLEYRARAIVADMPRLNDPNNPYDLNWPKGIQQLRDALEYIDKERAVH